MINKIRTILSGTSLTEREFDKCTKELCDLFSVRFSSEMIEELWDKYCYEVPDDDTVKVHGLISTKQMNRRRFIEAISSITDEA